MMGEQAEGDSRNTSAPEDRADDPGPMQTGGEIAEALARVQEAVIGVTEGGLQESLEVAIEAIDSAVREAPDKPEGDQLNAIADALEGALDELEKGRIANLLPVLDQAQSIVESDPSAKP
jgi:hypothetical protein